MLRQKLCIMSNKCNCKRCQCNINQQAKLYNRQLCYFHYNSLFGKATQYIQNIYRNNKMRNAINIYKALPGDLQNKVLFHMQENDLIKKHHHDVIEGIILRRRADANYKRATINVFGFPDQIYMKPFLNEIYDLLKLITKYKNILSYRTHHHLAIELGRIDQQIFNYNFFQSIGIEDDFHIALMNVTRFCLDMNACRIKNIHTQKWHQLYVNNIDGYEYFISQDWNMSIC